MLACSGTHLHVCREWKLECQCHLERGDAAGGPVAGDTVTVSNNNTVTVTTNATADSLTVAGGASNSTLTVSGGFMLTINGNVTINAPTANNITKLIDVPASAQLTINGNLTLNGGSSATRRAMLRLGSNAASSVTVTGGIVVSGTAPVITFQGPGTLNVGDDFASGAIFTASTGTVAYNGNGAQDIGNYTYSTLTIRKTGGTANAAAAITSTNLNIVTTSAAFAVNGSFNATTAALSTASGAALTMTGNLTATTAGFSTASNGAIALTGAVSATNATFSTASNGAITLNGALSGASATFTNAADRPCHDHRRTRRRRTSRSPAAMPVSPRSAPAPPPAPSPSRPATPGSSR